MTRRLVAMAALAVVGTSAQASGRAPAPRRGWEPEVHLTAGSGDPSGTASGYGAGVGGRVAFTLGSFDVSATTPDWIALGAGVELVRHAGGGSPFGTCIERTPGPAGTSVCTRVDAPGSSWGYVLIPVVARWSLGITPEASLFVEPGVGLVLADGGAGAGPLLGLGGTLRLGDAVNGVLRLGWPVSTLGVSF
jgi:hypothetical protein